MEPIPEDGASTSGYPPPPVGGAPSTAKSRPRRRVSILRDVFRAFDLDDSGEIEPEELLALGQARRDLHQRDGVWTEKDNLRLVAEMDNNGDGVIQEEEFTS